MWVCRGTGGRPINGSMLQGTRSPGVADSRSLEQTIYECPERETPLIISAANGEIRRSLVHPCRCGR